MKSKFSMSKSITPEEACKIVDTLLIDWYNFRIHGSKHAEVGATTRIYIDPDRSKFYFNGGISDIKTLYEKLRDDLENAEHNIEIFDLAWIINMVKLNKESQ